MDLLDITSISAWWAHLLPFMPPLTELWHGLFRPLLRLLLFMSVGLLVANIIETLNWTRGIAKLAAPLVRLGHMRDVAGASFSLAFISAMSSNSLLAENYEQGKISKRELIFSNLFNSLPANFTHLPTIFFMTYSALGWPAVIYVSLTVSAAALRTLLTILCGRLLLPPIPEGCASRLMDEQKKREPKAQLVRAWQRFCKRIPKLICFTVPIYIFMFIMQRLGYFQAAQDWLAQHIDFFTVLRPEAVGIVAFHIAAEFGAALAAASAVMNNGALSERDIVLALLLGNVLSTPMRAFRHQFPAYAGYFAPALALNLVIANQILRAVSIIFVGWLYYLWG